MMKITTRQIIIELMKVPAIKSFYKRCDHETITQLAFICNQSVDCDDDDSIESAIATWVTLGTFPTVNESTAKEAFDSESDLSEIYLRFKAYNELFWHKSALKLKMHLIKYRQSKRLKEKMLHSAELMFLYISVLLSSRLFLISSRQ